jgi:hypothetical protein
VQLIAETRPPFPTRPGSTAKYDYEYRRVGTAVNFMFTEPLQHWRKVNVRRTKTKKDWAETRNHQNGTVRWQFRTDNARIKLLHLYPEIET